MIKAHLYLNVTLKKKSQLSWVTFLVWIELYPVAVFMTRIEGPNFIFIKRLCSCRILQIKKVMLPCASGGLMDSWDHARITRPCKDSEKVTRNRCKHCLELSFHTSYRKLSLSDMFSPKGNILCGLDEGWHPLIPLDMSPCVCVCVCDAVLFCPTRSFTPHRERFKCGALCLPVTLTSSDCVWTFSLGCCAASTVGEHWAGSGCFYFLPFSICSVLRQLLSASVENRLGAYSPQSPAERQFWEPPELAVVHLVGPWTLFRMAALSSGGQNATVSLCFF